MVCIYCGGKTQVFNSRAQQRTNSVWRRRRCTECAQVFTSLESPDLARSWAFIGQDGKVHAFDPETLLISLYESLRHRKTSVADATALSRTVTAQLLKTAQSGRVTRDHVITTCLAVLKRFDKAAATYYAAFHKS